MKSKGRKVLVIDASVASSAGLTEHPDSKSCRDFLWNVLQICHKVVMTDAIFDEWQRHSSYITRLWFNAMHSNNKVLDKGNLLNEGLRNKVDATCDDQNRENVMKDIHLIEASLEANAIIISKDNRARRAYKRISLTMDEIEKILWVNPVEDLEESIDWLEKGARSRKKWRLDS